MYHTEQHAWTQLTVNLNGEQEWPTVGEVRLAIDEMTYGKENLHLANFNGEVQKFDDPHMQ
jgi:hypothetical protein